MPSALTLERVRRDIEVLAHAGLDTATFLAEVYASLQRAVPSSAACVATLDPATHLATGAFKFGALAGSSDSDELWGRLEYGHVEPTSYTELARAGIRAVGMSVVTRGDVQKSRRMRELVRSALGCADELRIVASAAGRPWGGMAMFRDASPYRDDDVEFMSSLSQPLARGLRVGLLARLAAEPPGPVGSAPAVMVFDAAGRLI